MISQLLSYFRNHWPVFLVGVVLAILLLRNPYSERTLIPNFEPFPDSFHYIVPPRCFLQGQGWRLCREGLEGVVPAVPPLYGFLLLPVFIISADPRSFYFLNVLLAFVSLGLLYLIAKKISANQFVQLLLITVFVTTYQVYWVPTLAMAENLLLPILLGIFYLISFKKLQAKHIAAISILAGLLYGSKYAGLPLMVGVCLVLGVRLLVEHFSKKLSPQVTSTRIAYATIPVLLLFLSFGGWRTVSSILNFEAIFASNTVQSIEISNSSWFGSEYFTDNIAIYLQAARGESTRFLWDFTPLVSIWMAVLGWFGIGYGLTKKRWVWLSSIALVTTILQLGILATFYSADTRYIYNLLPTVLIGIALFFIWLKDLLKSFSVTKAQLIISFSCILILLGYGFDNFTRLKSQVAINIKYAETPWWYLAITQMDAFVNGYYQQQPNAVQPIVISPISPYLIDFYATADFRVLPLDQMQDFRGDKVAVWGEDDYSDLLALYEQKLIEGYPVFVAKYGIGNEKSKQNAFVAIEEYFNLTEVQDGCFDQCDIFRVELKSDIQ